MHRNFRKWRHNCCGTRGTEAVRCASGSAVAPCALGLSAVQPSVLSLAHVDRSTGNSSQKSLVMVKTTMAKFQMRLSMSEIRYQNEMTTEFRLSPNPQKQPPKSPKRGMIQKELYYHCKSGNCGSDNTRFAPKLCHGKENSGKIPNEVVNEKYQNCTT